MRKPNMAKSRKNNLAKTLSFMLFIGLVAIAGCTDDAEPNSISNIPNAGSNIDKKNTNAALFESVSTGSLDNGDALVELAPKGMQNGKFAVELSINTHSVDLTQFDLMQITALEYGEKSVKPIAAPQLSGHHSSGELIFNVGEEIKSFKIIIKGIPAVEERVFEWG